MDKALYITDLITIKNITEFASLDDSIMCDRS